MVFSYPVPHGIEGHIYDLNKNGIQNIDFKITDLNTSQTIVSKTKSNGYYSVSLNGNDNNIIVLTTWNKYHISNRTIPLERVMQGVDLYINTSIPPVPPQILSTPSTQTTISKKYSYTINATDETNDTLTFGLKTYQKGMHVNKKTGLLQWIPTKKDIGIYLVEIIVSDGIFDSLHSFNLTITNEPSSQDESHSHSSTLSESQIIITKETDKTVQPDTNKIHLKNQNLSKPQISGPKEEYAIGGFIFKNFRKSQIEEGTTIKIKNHNNGDERITKTGIGSNPGAFYGTIKGTKGDNIQLFVSGKDSIPSFSLNGDVKNISITLGNDPKLITTGFSIHQEIQKKSIFGILIALIISTITYTFYSRKKEKIFKIR